jgi:hypothetical protein
LPQSSTDTCFATPPLWSTTSFVASAAAAATISALGRSLGQLTAAALTLAGEVEHPAGTTPNGQTVCWMSQPRLPLKGIHSIATLQRRARYMWTACERISTSAADTGARSGAHQGRCMRCTARRQPAKTMHHRNTSWETHAAHCGRLWHIWRVQSDTGAHKHLDVSLCRDNTVGTATVNDAVGLAPGMQEQVESRYYRPAAS